MQKARDEVKKAKGQLELSLAGDVKDNRKGFCRYVANKRKSRDSEEVIPSLELGSLQEVSLLFCHASVL